MEECGAHKILEKNVDKIHQATGEIFGLIRKSSEAAARADTRIVTLETEQRIAFKTIFRRLDEYEAQQERFSEVVTRRFDDLSGKLSQRKWTPKQIIALASVIIGPSGLFAWIAFFQ